MKVKAKVRPKPQVTLSESVRKKIIPRLRDTVRTEDRAAGAPLSPGGSADPALAWFWSKKWQEEERKVERDIRARRVKISKNVEAFLKDTQG